jgi:diacylglycerol kinase (ATP)
MRYDARARVIKVRSLSRSFKYAGRGIAYCVKNERNMRIHLVVAAYVLIFSPFYAFTQTQYILLLLTIGIVLFAETVNTAIEAIVNLETQCYDNLARIAKDVAAGAVLICAIFAAAVGIILYLKPVTIMYIIHFLVANPVLGVLFLLSLPAATAFIIGLPRQAVKTKKF